MIDRLELMSRKLFFFYLLLFAVRLFVRSHGTGTCRYALVRPAYRFLLFFSYLPVRKLDVSRTISRDLISDSVEMTKTEQQTDQIILTIIISLAELIQNGFPLLSVSVRFLFSFFLFFSDSYALHAHAIDADQHRKHKIFI